MSRGPSTMRQFATCVLLSVVLILGIVQWSFLPVLIQNPSFSGRAAVGVSPGHSAKFAAPSKFQQETFLQPGLKQANLAALQTSRNYFYQPKGSIFARDDQFFFCRQLRSPPSA
jgi:hypothetical protein